MIAFIVFENF